MTRRPGLFEIGDVVVGAPQAVRAGMDQNEPVGIDGLHDTHGVQGGFIVQHSRESLAEAVKEGAGD